MHPPDHKPEDFLITLGDALHILKKAKGRIACGAIIFSLLAGFFALTRPIYYKAEATFREKGNSQGGIDTSSLATIMFGSFASEGASTAKSMMLSRTLLQDVIEALDMQATVTTTRYKFPFLKKIKDNLRVEYNALRKQRHPPLPDIKTPIKAKHVTYLGEVLLTLELVFDTEETYQVIGPNKEVWGRGKVNTPFSAENFSFTLEKDHGFQPKTCSLTLSPLVRVATTLSKTILIEPNKDDPSLMELSYDHPDRHFASKILNQLMSAYQNYLRNDQNRVAEEQIAYLYKREEAMGEKLKELFEMYANKVSSKVSNMGYASSEIAMDAASSQMKHIQEKLLEIDLELKRVEKHEKHIYDSLYQSKNAPVILNELVAGIHQFKQQADSIELALRRASHQVDKETEQIFSQQVKDLDEIRGCCADAQRIVLNLENRQPIPEISLFDKKEYMVKTWHDELLERQRDLKAATLLDKERKRADLENFVSQFINYLNNLIHFLHVKEKTIQERLLHQQSPSLEFQGINLNTARDLYIQYSTELSKLEAQILQLNYIIDQLQEPGFEVSSLSSVITDPVTSDLVEKASEFVLALQDDANRSPKEKDRLKKELDNQKRFLDLHLQQTIQMLHLRENLLQDKIDSLQNTSLELIQQQVSILERQLVDTQNAYINHLKQERQLMEEQQLTLRSDMALLPQQWTTEKLMDQQATMYAKMMEEITKLVESKNIANHLEVVQSAPIDISIPSTHPVRPKTFLFMLLGGLLGGFFSAGFVFVQTIAGGTPASRDNLELFGVHVSGVITKNQAENLRAFRRFIAYLVPGFSRNEKLQAKSSQTLALIKGKGWDYSHEIAQLLSKRGFSLILLDLTFEKKSTFDEQTSGLLHYLEGEIEFPTINRQKGWDSIDSGGFCDLAHERLGSQKFSQLMDDLKSRYDWVIGITNALPNEPETENFIHLFDHALITICHETQKDLKSIIQLALNVSPEKKVSFMITE